MEDAIIYVFPFLSSFNMNTRIKRISLLAFGLCVMCRFYTPSLSTAIIML